MVSPLIAGAIARKGTKETGKFLEEKLGYNFIDLVTKLLLFYSISFIISKYMEAVIYFQGGLQTIAGFFGIKLVQSDQLPPQWVELFVTGTPFEERGYDPGVGTAAAEQVEGFGNPPGWDRPYDYGTPEHEQAEPRLFPKVQTKLKFWDFVNAIAVFYIGWEAYRYYSNGGRDFLTLGIFALIISVLSVLSFSKFIGRFGFNKFQEDNK